MGGRGASMGWSLDKYGNRLHKYGTEYRSVYNSGNIKYLEHLKSKLAKTPMETMTSGRVYVTLATGSDGQQHPKSITYYDKNNKRFKQIDIIGPAHNVAGKPVLPHTHIGYVHDENGTRAPTPKEQKMIDRVNKIWDNRLNNK